MMKNQPLTTFVLALKNLGKRSFRAKCLVTIVAVFAFVIFCGTLLSQSLSLGQNYLSGRMGADIMVVPRGSALTFQNTLLKSKSNTFFMEENLAEKIAVIPGVERVSSQLYIESLNATCCSVPVQLIGFDPRTDFTIKSWMGSTVSGDLAFGEVVTGSRVNSKVGEEVWFFGQPLKVAATLDNSGMGFDSSIFMTMETMQHMVEQSEQAAIHPVGTGKDTISALFVKLTANSDVLSVSKEIVSAYPQTDVVVLNEIMQNISIQLNNLKGLVYGIQVASGIITGLLLAVIFTFTTNERKREFGLLLALGATRKKLERIIVTETLILSLLGALCGVAAACLIMFDFRMLIAVSLGLPYLQPEMDSIIILAALSIIIPVLIGVSACLYSVMCVGRMETNTMIREYEG